jgi:hypothetical protein
MLLDLVSRAVGFELARLVGCDLSRLVRVELEPAGVGGLVNPISGESLGEHICRGLVVFGDHQARPNDNQPPPPGLFQRVPISFTGVETAKISTRAILTEQGPFRDADVRYWSAGSSDIWVIGASLPFDRQAWHNCGREQ